MHWKCVFPTINFSIVKSMFSSLKWHFTTLKFLFMFSK